MKETLSLFDHQYEKNSRRNTMFIPYAQVIETPEHPLIHRLHILREPEPGERRQKLFGRYLSPSRISKFTYCQAQYFFHYHQGMREPSNSALIFGSAMHAAGELYLWVKRESVRKGFDFAHEGTRRAAIDVALEYVHFNVKENTKWKKQWQNGPEETKESLIESIQVGVEKMADESWQALTPQKIEQGYVIEWKSEEVLPILGYTDVIDLMPNGLERVIDLKSGKEKKEMDAKLDRALSLYAIAREIETGKPVREVGYESYVRNKAPKIVHVAGQRDEVDFVRMFTAARAMSNIRQNIEDDPTGQILPIDDASKCSGCFFKAHCDKTFGSAAAIREAA